MPSFSEIPPRFPPLQTETGTRLHDTRTRNWHQFSGTGFWSVCHGHNVGNDAIYLYVREPCRRERSGLFVQGHKVRQRAQIKAGAMRRDVQIELFIAEVLEYIIEHSSI